MTRKKARTTKRKESNTRLHCFLIFASRKVFGKRLPHEITSGFMTRFKKL